MKSCTTLLSIFALTFAVIGGFLLFYPLGYLYATYENLYGEWLQFSSFVGIAVFSFLIVKKKRAPRAWFWVLLGLAAFYTAMEEISWGQQIFGWQSTEFFQKKNLQGETNLHNMFTGPYSTITKDLLTYVLAAGMFAYGILYPLMLSAGVGVAKWAEGLGVPNPTLCLMPYFAVAAVCEMSFFHFNEAELAELFTALALFFLAINTYLRGAPSAPASDRGLAKAYGIGFVIAVLIAVGMTQFSINASQSERRVANRIEAGVKKFAGRYARIGSWQHAIDLYERHLAYDPDSRSRMRRLASAYRSAGLPEEQRKVLQNALQIDLQKLKEDAWRASLHRSLFRTYRALGDKDNAQKHINEALKINQQRLRDHPNSADAAYSIARTYDLVGRDAEAVQQYRRAFQLKPGSSKYRRAYRDAID